MKCKTDSCLFFFLLLISYGFTQAQNRHLTPLKISDNKHFLVDENNNPFFWLGDTGWLLFTKLNRKQAEEYLDDRSKKGFNVIQVMVIHDIENTANIYGDSALLNKDISKPLETTGASFENNQSYDFWDHVDYIIRLAEKKGIYIALVPVWGTNVKRGVITVEQAKQYGTWLGKRYQKFPNIIWLNGGDVLGSDSTAIWNSLGNALHKSDPNHLVSFHPFGRTQSSRWFHHEPWLQFNMVQSGHRRYDQDDTKLSYGEDNWRYIQKDYQLFPPKPTIDGEPSYEGIPQGLHDTLQPYWKDADTRRYAYWSVFAGAFGFTYGNNAVMQFYKQGEKPAYGAKKFWQAALDDPGAGQMKYLKWLMLSRRFLDRVPDQAILAENDGKKYNYLIATRGKDYAFIYTYTGNRMKINMGKIEGDKVTASWFNPRNGVITKLGEFVNKGILEFKPPGETGNGNDWILILDTSKS